MRFIARGEQKQTYKNIHVSNSITQSIIQACLWNWMLFIHRVRVFKSSVCMQLGARSTDSKRLLLIKKVLPATTLLFFAIHSVLPYIQIIEGAYCRVVVGVASEEGPGVGAGSIVEVGTIAGTGVTTIDGVEDA